MISTSIPTSPTRPLAVPPPAPSRLAAGAGVFAAGLAFAGAGAVAVHAVAPATLGTIAPDTAIGLAGGLAALGGGALASVRRRRGVRRAVATQRLLDLQQQLATAGSALDRGQLVGELAHELRNPLAGLQMSLVNLADELPDDEHRARVGRALDEVMRIAGTLDRMVEQSPASEPAQTVDVDAMLGDVRRLVEARLRKGVRLRIAPAPRRAVVPRDRLGQALVLLLLHLADRLPDSGGEIRVDVAPAPDGALTLRVRVAVSDPEAVLQPPGREREAPLTMVERLARETGGRFTRSEESPGKVELALELPDAVETGPQHVRDPAPDRRREAPGGRAGSALPARGLGSRPRGDARRSA